jgi:amino acid adenylation domain-containing protein
VDGRSVVILLNDLFEIYQSLQAGQELDHRPAPAYREYIEWLQAQDWSEAERFWRKRLEGFTATTSLPMRRCASNGSSSGGSWAEEETVLPENTINALREMAKAHGLTLNTLLQGAWGLVLSRYSGEEDVVFGAVKACRHLPVSGTGEIAGPLINTLPIRMHCAANQSLIQWLGDLRKQWMELRQFEHSPLASIQSWSQVPVGRPLFETILNVLDPPWSAVLQKAWGKRNFGIRNQPNYPLALDVYVAGAARLTLVYDAVLFERPAIRRMLGHLRTVLESMPGAAEQRVGDLPLLTAAERLELLEKWNDTHKSYPPADCVHRLFEAQVQQTPEALAISSGAVRVSYRQLNERANRVAHRLVRLGIRPETRVGICMERSAENIVGLLGILKAGGAYVPLDPDYPRERLAFMISDAGIQVLLTQQKWTDRLPPFNGQVICLDESEAEAEPIELRDLPDPATPTNLAYIIYTSGSTGTPKGVEIEHQGLVNLICWHQERYQVRGEDRATQLASLSFDASVWELWPYLTAGASIHIPDEQTRLNSEKLVYWLVQEKITLTFLPTPLAETIMDGPWPHGTALRALLTGGDRLHRAPKEALPFQLVNHYGPTENSVVTTAAAIESHTDGCEAPPIGRPIANTRLYILDERLRPVPIGVPGELFITGAGLARGYLNQPKLTAEKFIPNPFSDASFSRLYRTGDLVRYREDGNVEFLGRIDQQVKLRGYRIELGEIESVLSTHENVRDAAVTAREEGQTRLAAYIVPENGKAPSAQELRYYLKQKLPEHMVPSAFMFLDALPLTPNGKVDRKALPAPDFKQPENDFVAPRNHVEEVLAGIWCELLRLPQVGVHDNFFALGGHSLLATQVISRVRNALGTELPLQALFENPTVEQFAERHHKFAGDQTSSKPLMRRNNDDNDGDVELSFGQERLWFLEQLEPGLAVYNVPVALVLQGKLDIPALQRSLNSLVGRHGSLRTSFGTAEGRPKARRGTAVDIELPTVSLEDLSSEEQHAEMERIMTSEAERPFELSQAPLLRGRLLRLSSQKHVLLLTTHHIISDGWSMAILYRELQELYGAYTQGKSAALPPLPVGYDDYARWQREWLQGEVLEEQLAFWRQHLHEPLPALDLPLDHPRPAQQSYRGAVKHFALPNHLCTALKALSRREDVTLFMLLLSAFQTLLHRYSGQDDIVTGTTVAGRTRSEIEGLVGLFLNTLALRTDLSGEVTFRGLLRRVRKAALETYAHQHVPFEKVVEALGVERDLSRSPVFQTMFILQKAPLPAVRAGDSEWSSVSRHNGTSKFDLTLSMEEEAEGLSGYVEYNCDLFESNTVSRMLTHFQTLLEAVVTNPDQKLWELPLLTTAERDQLMLEWNNTRTDFPRQACLHHLFEAQVARTPNAIVIVFDEKSLTYRELNREADRLAHHLRGLGVQAETIVGICLDRSLEMMIGLLAVLKAGGAYLPLDPAYPAERLAYMLEDSRAALVITQRNLLLNLKDVSATCILIDEPLRDSQAKCARASTSAAQASDPAYIIYTSGSTGKPKGVVVPHRAIVNFLTSMACEPGLTADDALVAVTTLSFDIAALELFLPITLGARVIIAKHDETVDGHALASLLERHSAKVMQATPVTWRLLLEAGWGPRANFKALVGGEPLPKDLADQLISSGVEVWNMYGPTETTVWSTCAHITDTSNGITIGSPIANTTIRILDGRNGLCLIGIPGELCIGGDGVALGYWNRPELTAERFIPDPFSTTPGARLYRTGDRARWRSDGTLEHLGRLDFQVKLRGFRIELGEIESGIARHPAVREVAVMVREDTPGDKRLVAYLVAETPPGDLINQLRALLRATVPEYMVPAQFVILEALPRTQNGKLDRRALPAPAVENDSRRGAVAAPQTPTEELALSVFHAVLGRTDFGVFDNFFDLGGHSLLAARLMARLATASGVELPVRELFAQPTVAAVAEAIDTLKKSTSPTPSAVREVFVI